MTKRLLISFSGGRTSAFMAAALVRSNVYDEILVTFANTGQEHEETLRFVDRCDREFSLGVVWLEAKVDPTPGVGTSFTQVSFETATRVDGPRGNRTEPYEDVVKKFGVANKHYPNCNRELKLRPIHAYCRSIGWRAKSYETAIGIRADEMDRISAAAANERIIYPLVKWGVTKSDVLAFWKTQSFDLYIPEHLGNCVWCWKKSLRKHLTLARDYPEVFEFPARMEETYPFAGPGTHEGPRRFFRGNRSARDILDLAKEPFEPFTDQHAVFDPELDTGGGCGGGESCDIFADGVEDD